MLTAYKKLHKNRLFTYQNSSKNANKKTMLIQLCKLKKQI